MLPFSLRPGVISALFGVAMVVAIAPPHEARASDRCEAGIQEIDTLLKVRDLADVKRAQIVALRENAVIRHSKGDILGCLRDISDIKILIGA